MRTCAGVAEVSAEDSDAAQTLEGVNWTFDYSNLSIDPLELREISFYFLHVYFKYRKS